MEARMNAFPQPTAAVNRQPATLHTARTGAIFGHAEAALREGPPAKWKAGRLDVNVNYPYAVLSQPRDWGRFGSDADSILRNLTLRRMEWAARELRGRATIPHGPHTFACRPWNVGAAAPRTSPPATIPVGQAEYAQKQLSDPTAVPDFAFLEACLGGRATDVSSKAFGGRTMSIVELDNGLRCLWKPARSESSPPRNNLEVGLEAQREAAVYVIDRVMGHYAGVLPTIYRAVNEERGALLPLVTPSPSNVVDATVWHRLAVFDMVIGNLDRHEGNFLASGTTIIPIDHGLTMPLKNGAQGYMNALFSTTAPMNRDDRRALEALVENRHALSGELTRLGLSAQAVDAMYERVTLLLKDGWSTDWFSNP